MVMVSRGGWLWLVGESERATERMEDGGWRGVCSAVAGGWPVIIETKMITPTQHAL